MVILFIIIAILLGFLNPSIDNSPKMYTIIWYNDLFHFPKRKYFLIWKLH